MTLLIFIKLFSILTIEIELFLSQMILFVTAVVVLSLFNVKVEPEEYIKLPILEYYELVLCVTGNNI